MGLMISSCVPRLRVLASDVWGAFFFFLGGVPFLLALCLFTILLVRRGNIIPVAGKSRVVISSVVVLLAYPIGLYSDIPWRLELLLQDSRYHLYAFWYKYDLCLHLIVAALVVWIALSVFTRGWSKMHLAMLILSALSAGVLVANLSNKFNPPATEMILFTVTQGLFGAICGYAIGNTRIADQRGKKPNQIESTSA